MGLLVKPNTFNAGSVIVAAEHNANFDTLYNGINGDLSNVNISASASIAASKLNLSSIAQTIAMSSVAVNFAKGSDIASASTADIGAASGNFVDVTGTTTITGLGTVQAGTWRIVRFTGALTLTHNATSLILPNNGSNITTVANDRAGFVSLGSGNWLCLWYQRAAGTPLVPVSASTALSGSVIQTVNVLYSTSGSGTTAVPLDTSKPQITEGDELTTLAITPNNTSNKLLIDVTVAATANSAGAIVAVSLFQDATADALMTIAIQGANVPAHFQYYMTAGTTSSTTFKVRLGAASGTTYWNRRELGDIYGGALTSSITIQEIKA